jgi:tRNA (guanine-N7-)-methyltransferase
LGGFLEKAGYNVSGSEPGGGVVGFYLSGFYRMLSERTYFDWPEKLQGRLPWVEIGFGNGEFLEHLAGAFSHQPMVGIEVSLTCLDKAARRLHRLGAENVRLLLGDARFLLRECFKDDGVERIFMNFPCPWPKNRHARRRITSKGFADVIASVLCVGGTFRLVTDEEWYAREAMAALGEHPALCSRLEDVEASDRPGATKYERKWRALGKNILSVVVEKATSWRGKRLVEEERALHVEVVFEGDLWQCLRALKGREGHRNEAYWIFREVFGGDDGSVLVRVIANDDGFEQRFFLRAVRRNDRVLVKIDDTATPFRTPAVRFALEEAAGILANHLP